MAGMSADRAALRAGASPAEPLDCAANPPYPVRPGRSRPLVGAAALLAGALVAALSLNELAGVDLGYHLVYGRRILDAGEIVRRDPFLYSPSAVEFVNANWGSQAIIALVERLGGGAGLSIFASGLIAAAFALVAATLRRAGAGWGVVGPVWLLAGLAAYERFTLRPELFTFLFAAAWVLLVPIVCARPVRGCLISFLLQAAWTNLHGYFVVGPIWTGSMLVGAALRHAFGRSSGRDARGAPPSQAAAPNYPDAGGRRDSPLRADVLAMILLAQVAGCFVNPRGPEGALFPLRALNVLRQQEAPFGGPGGVGDAPWAAISEFHAPLSYVGFPAARRTIDAYLLLLAMTVAGCAAALRIGRWDHAAGLAALALMSLAMRRNIAVLALAGTPIAAGALAGWFRASVRLRPIRGPAVRAAALMTVLACAYWLPQVSSGQFYASERRAYRRFGAGVSPQVVPCGAAAWLRAQSALRPRLFADFFSSSNVIPLLGPGDAVFVNTNTFAYAPDALATLHDVCGGRVPHAELFDRLGVNVVLLHADDNTRPLISALYADPAWPLAWFDAAFVVFVRRIPEHAEIVARRRAMPADLRVDEWVAAAHRRGTRPGFDLTLRSAVPICVGWFERSHDLLQHAVGLDPDLPEAWLNLGVCHAMLANRLVRGGGSPPRIALRLQRAVACFERVKALEPGNAAADANLDRARRALRALDER